MFDPAPQTVAAPKVPKVDSEILRVLKTARAVIADKHNWCQRQAFNGHRMCVVGAIRAIAGGNGYRAYGVLVKAADQIFRKPSPVWVNDYLGHAAVLGMFDRAIELAEGTAVCPVADGG